MTAPVGTKILGSSSVALASKTFSMEDRYNVPSVNTVFKDNILLTLRYMNGDVKSKAEVDWNKVTEPFHAEFTLKPSEEFAFHDKELPDYANRVVKTMNSHFIGEEGFKSDGFLYGDGVCHLASFINWVAKDAGLGVYYSASHSFAKINDVPAQYGVSIDSKTAYQNLYITNTKEVPVTFTFDFDGTNLKVSVMEVKGSVSG